MLHVCNDVKVNISPCERVCFLYVISMFDCTLFVCQISLLSTSQMSQTFIRYIVWLQATLMYVSQTGGSQRLRKKRTRAINSGIYVFLSGIIQKGPYWGPCLNNVQIKYPLCSTFLSYATMLHVCNDVKVNLSPCERVCLLCYFHFWLHPLCLPDFPFVHNSNVSNIH